MFLFGILLSPRFLEKASGILLSPPSVCPSVRLSVMLSPPKPLDGIQPNLVSGLLTQVGRARARLFLGPAPRGPGEGSKGQILTISNFKVNFKDYLCENVHIYSVVIDVKHIEQDLLCNPRNTLWGGTWGVGWGQKLS